MDPNLRSKIEDFVALKDKESDKYFAWLRNILAMAIGLIGILVSLRPTERMEYYPHLLFSLAIGLISLGILTGAVILFVEIKLLGVEIEIKAKWINKILRGTQDEFEVESIPNPWYFKVVKAICYLSFSLSLVVLTTYTFLT